VAIAKAKSAGPKDSPEKAKDFNFPSASKKPVVCDRVFLERAANVPIFPSSFAVFITVLFFPVSF
jgi:hypothetical protein